MGALVVLAGLVPWCLGEPRHIYPRDQILAAILLVESGGNPTPPDGDGGLAIGPYQIHRVYWQDAVAQDPSLGGSYQHCRDRAYAERVVGAYMTKWVPAAWRDGDAETVARTHNGGPQGAHKRATEPYWQKVLQVLARTRSS